MGTCGLEFEEAIAISEISTLFNSYSKFGIGSAFSKGPGSGFSEGPGPGPGPLYKICLSWKCSHSNMDLKISCSKKK